MSLATRCPACGTIFRVVQDQLRVSEGWVRCGQCQEVFHGIEALFDLDNDPAVAARRAAARTAVMPPPARVFGAPPGSAAPAPEAAEPAAAMPPPPAATTPRPPRFTQPPVAARGTIAPRFAARLAQESARVHGGAPAPVPPPPPVPPTPATAPAMIEATPDLRDIGVEPAWIPEPAPAPIPVPVSAPAPAPAPVTLPAPEPVPEPVPAPIVTAPTAVESPMPAPAETGVASAAPEPAPAPPPEEATPPVADAPAAVAHGASESTTEPEPESPPAPRPVEGMSPAAASLLPDIEPLHDPGPSGAPEEPRAGPPTLASMLPDVGEWPPRRTRKRTPATAGRSEQAMVDRSKDPRFLREARSGARWHRPWVRAALGATLLLLIVAAAGQVAWPQRDLLAARWPATQPAWAWLCEQAGCRIAAPRVLASLSLDGSSLTRTDAEHVLLFSADLHNRADNAVAVPSFDLTFLDLNGAIVARKVLTPAQIGIRQASLPPEGELHVHARLQVGTLPASGFQADLFYP